MLMKKNLSYYVSIYNTKETIGLRKHCHNHPIVAVKKEALPKI